MSPPSGGHNTNTRKCHASPSYSPPSKRQRYRHLTALHLNQKCRYLDVVITTIGTAPYQPCRRPHTPRPQVPHPHSAIDTAATGEGTTADTDDITALGQPPSHPSHVPLLYKETCRTISTRVCKLLLSPHTPPLFMSNQNQPRKRKTEKRQVTDLNSWLEAWNRYTYMYAICRIASDSAMALELIKYQMVVSLLFARYPASSVIEYDRLFCQVAARDCIMRWDSKGRHLCLGLDSA